VGVTCNRAVVARPPISLLVVLLLVTAILIGVSLRFFYLTSRELWYDEVLSLVYAAGGREAYGSPGAIPVALRDYATFLNLPAESTWSDTLHTFKNILKGVRRDPHPPLFYLFLHLWMRLFGNGEVAIRSLVALVSIGAIAAAYGFGRMVLGHRGGLLLAALLSTSPYYLFHSLNVRMYAPLVLWTIASAWAMLRLIDQQDEGVPKNRLNHLFWNSLLIGSVAAGLLTQYLFAYWVVTLAVLAFCLDRRRWWRHALPLGAGVVVTIPWVLWGSLPQLQLAAHIFHQLAAKGGQAAWLKHLHDAALVLANHFLLGNWTTRLPLTGRLMAGLLVTLLISACTVHLWRLGERKILAVVWLLGIFPVILALAIDIGTNNFAVGHGGARAMIFILPGCLLLLALWVERATGRWYGPAAAALLVLYLSVSVADLSLNQRRTFRTVAGFIDQQPGMPTLIAMNSKAWGYVLRLAYYIPLTAPVMLLAEVSARLAPALETAIRSDAKSHFRVLWLDSAHPVWSSPATETERKNIQRILNAGYQPAGIQILSGMGQTDTFTLLLYTRSPTTWNAVK